MSILTHKDFTKKLDSVKRRNKTLRADLQELLVYAAMQAFLHGNVNTAAQVYAATNMDKACMARWLAQYGFAARVTNDKGETVFKLRTKEVAMMRDTSTEADVRAYLENEAPDWWTLKPAAPEADTSFDLESAVQRLLKQIDKAKKENKRLLIKSVDDQVRELQRQIDIARIAAEELANDDMLMSEQAA